MPSIPAIGAIIDPTKVSIALVQGQQLVRAPVTALSDAVGVPSGGTTGQVLTKSSDTDYASGWADIPAQGDFSGPASSIDGNLVAFDGTTGKLGKDSGIAVTAFAKTLLNDADAATMRGTLATIGIVRTQKFTSSGTYTPNANVIFAIAEGVGGGGGGGGVAYLSGQSRRGAGGGSGGYSRSILPSGTQTVTIGAAGAAGTSTSAGGTGGATSVGTSLVANGGVGGLHYDGSTGFGGGGYGGSAGTGGILALPGNTAGGGGTVTLSYGVFSGEPGAPSYFGGMGGKNRTTAAGAAAGADATGPGGGGGGGLAGASSTTSTANGGAGAAGIVIITEFCSK